MLGICVTTNWKLKECYTHMTLNAYAWGGV